jgi:hypothetical protein
MLRSWARRDYFRVGGGNQINIEWDFELISISNLVFKLVLTVKNNFVTLNIDYIVGIHLKDVIELSKRAHYLNSRAAKAGCFFFNKMAGLLNKKYKIKSYISICKNW